MSDEHDDFQKLLDSTFLATVEQAKWAKEYRERKKRQEIEAKEK